MRSSVLRGSLTLGVADFSRKALLAVTVLLCARLLPAGEFGDYIFLLSFYQIFAVLAGAGLPSTLLRTVARDNSSGIRLAVASVLARATYILPASVLMYVVMWSMGFLAQYRAALLVLAAMMIVRGTAENVSFIFQGREDQVRCAKVGITQSAVTLVATLAVCFTSKNLLLVLGAHVAGGFVSAVYGFILLRSHKGSIQEHGTFRDHTKLLLRESHWLNAGAFVASVYNRVDVLLLRRFITSEAVALYAAPYRLLDLAQIIPSSLTATILPGLCRRSEAAPATMHPPKAMRLLIVIALALITMVTMCAPWMILILFGQTYRHGSIAVLEILIWATVPMFWNFVLNAQLIAHAYDRAILYAASVGLAVNLTLNLLFIPRFGFLACAVITIVTEIAMLAANLRLLAGVDVRSWPEHSARLAASTLLIAGFCVCWTRSVPAYTFASAGLLVLAIITLPIFASDLPKRRLRGQ